MRYCSLDWIFQQMEYLQHVKMSAVVRFYCVNVESDACWSIDPLKGGLILLQDVKHL